MIYGSRLSNRYEGNNDAHNFMDLVVDYPTTVIEEHTAVSRWCCLTDSSILTSSRCNACTGKIYFRIWSDVYGCLAELHTKTRGTSSRHVLESQAPSWPHGQHWDRQSGNNSAPLLYSQPFAGVSGLHFDSDAFFCLSSSFLVQQINLILPGPSYFKELGAVVPARFKQPASQSSSYLHSGVTNELNILKSYIKGTDNKDKLQYFILRNWQI